MLARRFTATISLAAAVAALCVPTAALAGPTDELSAFDTMAADLALDGSLNTSSSEVLSQSGESPTSHTYGTDTEILPPPVDCVPASTDTSGGGSSVIGSPVCDTPVSEKPPVTETETVTETLPETTVVGGGGETPEVPAVAEGTPVTGGGVPVNVDSQPVPVAAGGGAGLPFTGQPLAIAMYGGVALMLLGGALWTRTHRRALGAPEA
jgi:hypothetical protein